MNSVKPAGRVALVTGAARGIGAATVVALARRGIASVVAVRKPDSARETAEAVRNLGVPCIVATCDVTDYNSVSRCIASTIKAWGRIDIVINNAGQIEPQAPLAQTDPALWAQAVSANLVGPYNVIHAALPELLRHDGAIINVSTGAAHTPRRGWSAYCSSKAGLFMLSRSLLSEYGERGLSVYSLQPGLVDTEMQARIRDMSVNEIGLIPQVKLARPQLSAGVIAWLADTLPRDLMGSDLSVSDQVLLERAGIPI
jgi:NAD(P)-dependent dehydrogenase (short-subunit alcohol dehydrogenase family)